MDIKFIVTFVVSVISIIFLLVGYNLLSQLEFLMYRLKVDYQNSQKDIEHLKKDSSSHEEDREKILQLIGEYLETQGLKIEFKDLSLIAGEHNMEYGIKEMTALEKDIAKHKRQLKVLENIEDEEQ